MYARKYPGPSAHGALAFLEATVPLACTAQAETQGGVRFREAGIQPHRVSRGRDGACEPLVDSTGAVPPKRVQVSDNPAQARA